MSAFAAAAGIGLVVVQAALVATWRHAPARLHVARQSRALRNGLAATDAELDLVDQVRGRGLMLGAVLKPAHAGRAGVILDACAREGWLLLQAGPDVLRFVPTLNIADADLTAAQQRLRSALTGLATGDYPPIDG